MNPGAYNISLVRGSRFDAYFMCKDSSDAPVPLTAWTPVVNVYRGNDLVFTSLAQGANPPQITVVKEPGAVTGRISVSIGSDITAGLLQPVGQLTLGMRWRLDLIDSTLAGNDVALLDGDFDMRAV